MILIMIFTELTNYKFGAAMAIVPSVPVSNPTLIEVRKSCTTSGSLAFGLSPHIFSLFPFSLSSIHSWPMVCTHRYKIK